MDRDCADSGDGKLYVGAAKRDITPIVEPFVDSNNNQRWDEGEPFTDRGLGAGGGHFCPITRELLPGDPTGQTAYVVMNGFSGDVGGTPASSRHVFKTTNAGGTWTDISGNLPDQPCESIAVDGGICRRETDMQHDEQEVRGETESRTKLPLQKLPVMTLRTQ